MRTYLCVLILAFSLSAPLADAASRPNIVILLADDWGLTDVGEFGSEIATPNLDALARQGARFSNFHVLATCSPTRSVLMTGVDNHRNGVGNMLLCQPLFQRVDQAGYPQPIDERILDDTDTLLVFGLDHLTSGLEVTSGEVDALREWLRRDGTCLLVAPHHDVGFTDDLAQRQMEYEHHGDRLVPRQQRFSQYTRSLMAALDVPVHNTWGLRPAVVDGTKDIAPLTAFRDLDGPGLLVGVPTLSFHQHLPHYELTAPEGEALRVLARQRVDPHRPHPFTAAGNTAFNALIWMPPTGDRAGDIVLIDSTHFTTLFGGTDSLKNLWHNLVTMA